VVQTHSPKLTRASALYDVTALVDKTESDEQIASELNSDFLRGFTTWVEPEDVSPQSRTWLRRLTTAIVR
jgi:hypothetical protein